MRSSVIKIMAIPKRARKRKKESALTMALEREKERKPSNETDFFFPKEPSQPELKKNVCVRLIG